MKCKIEIAIDDAKSGKITDMPHGIASRPSRCLNKLPLVPRHLPNSSACRRSFMSEDRGYTFDIRKRKPLST